MNTATKETFKFDSSICYDEVKFWDLIRRHEEFPEEIFGENDDGELVGLSINKDNITMTTFQNNGWTRKDIHWMDGYHEEIYGDRWE